VHPIWDQEPYRLRAAAYEIRLRTATNAFSYELRSSLNLSSGTYLFFNHVTRLLLRCADVQSLLLRLFDQRAALRDIDTAAQMPARAPMRTEHGGAQTRLARAIRLDFEALYVFANMALDLWAATTARVIGSRKPLSFDHFRVYAADPTKCPGPLQIIVSTLAADILWLAAMVRFYRNEFVVHVERPWQISHGHTVQAYDFTLWSPLVASRTAAKALDRDSAAIAAEVGLRLEGPHTAHQVLFELLMRIGQIPDRAIRRRIFALQQEHGTATPSFHIVGDRVLGFLAASTEFTLQLALANPTVVVLGKV
jgi:hypothetical protein